MPMNMVSARLFSVLVYGSISGIRSVLAFSPITYNSHHHSASSLSAKETGPSGHDVRSASDVVRAPIPPEELELQARLQEHQGGRRRRRGGLDHSGESWRRLFLPP